MEVFNNVRGINVHRSLKNKKCMVLERSLTSCKAKRKENILIFLTILNKLGRISDVFCKFYSSELECLQLQLEVFRWVRCNLLPFDF